ncbi:MAG TPA: aminotransferase class III-fold pyridoxal phosphate-dependent enzyme [Solirubrobacteraceae bacterium]|nr:aminotransferase class III-fold pyridoxal phosphate-dependent enzyme [Solirubrobacteraceae bacterium]
MTSGEDTRLWHPFADMGSVRSGELVIERGEDVWVWDRDGKRYLDGTASLWYANVGHGRPEIAAAVAAQMARLETYSAFGDFATEPARELAETLADLAPMPARVFLGSGGGDAVDTAAKLARRYWYELGEPDRTLLMSRTAGYHGTHGYGTALAGIPANRDGFGPQVETVQVPHDSLEAMEAAIREAGAERVAAVFVEPVIGAGGVYPPVPGYIEGLASLCERTGVLLVVDSVICGFGRLGTWFGIERWGVEPAMVVFAKGVTSGYLPLGGVLVSERVAEPFWREPHSAVFRHGATYSGHATCCAAALANIALLERDGLVERARDLEAPLLDALARFAGHGAVAEVRGGVGLLAAVAFTDEILERRPDAVMRVVMAAREAGVLLRPLGRAVAASPPLTVSGEHLALIGEAFERGLAAL